MILFLDNPTGHVDTVKQSQVQSYDEEVLGAGWNPALNELRACLLTVAEAERARGRRRESK
jgi:hypothetical protein